ncbi:MAG: S46 family peptidase [Bacteroidaceae bacterium]|nr:S46 family peptidase [Bacteroidaceae bacterium]
MKRILFLLLTIVSLTSHADEGMWMLNRIDQQTADVMKGLGLKLSPRQLYDPEGVSLKDCVVDFCDFCSGVVVSPQGLVFTNHHCGFSGIQKLSTPEDDILKNGFAAKSFEEERPVDGFFVRFLDRTVDCTSRIMLAMDSIYKANPGVEAKKLDRENLDSVMTAVEREYTRAYPDRYCLVKSYYGGNAYYVSIYKTYNDIRLVFTPTQAMGKFGGDTDNWMWPRQTCDFSVFRIYADKDGNPAEYSKDNVPLKPKRYAKVSLAGFQPGDFCMTVGYPGSTDRYLSSYGIHERTEAINTSRIDVRGKKQEVWKRWMKSDRAIAIKYASKYASSSNYWKNSIGMNKAVADLDVMGQKQQLEQDIRQWYGQDKQLTARFGTMFDELEQAYANRFKAIRAYGFFSETFLRGIELRRVATVAASKPMDMDSTEVAIAREQAETFYKDYDPRVDEETMAVLLANYRQQVAAEYLPSIYNTIDSLYGGDTKAYAHDLFSRTVLTDISCVDSFMADSTLKETDPMFLYNESITEEREKLQKSVREESQSIDYNEHLLTQAILEREQETPHYSDANFSIRLSYGFIQDYTAGSQHFDYYTNVQSLLDKAARQDEIDDYRLEGDIVRLLQQRDFGRYADLRTKDLHLCFLSNNDITGGNSGSPMFNGKGELIGLAFDGNWEAMSGDITFNPELQRCIGVDIRFVLYLIDKWGKADRLIKELVLKNQ